MYLYARDILHIITDIIIVLIIYFTIRGTFRAFKKFLFELIDKIKE